MDKLGDASAVIEALPAIDTDEDPGYDPFDRNDLRTRTITTTDEHLLTGEPEPPLRIFIPVQIDG